ncbi:YjbF family lipoprotein [Marimonas arenosa]|uniref:YjbF family lipoprotein n=1 Tax=Marimonas arenosa TaxID=1795305 RepID=A0AAE3WF29_9RHOB|nr:YjbF family lipoprotein [Marimonas arenosa]MDQ2090542.1 YjbF family lipoprotein [Marimonas arenosa]
MTVLRKIARLAALAAVAALAGCGNETDQGLVYKSVLQGLSQNSGQTMSAMAPEQTAAAVQASLAQTDLPLALAVVEKRQATAILANIETNGAYRTWGTSDRRTVTTAQGLVTATRGLGNDIMSSSVSQVAALVTGRKAGTGRRVMRYLDGENHTVEIASDCRIARGGQKRVSSGTIQNVLVTEMSEICSMSGGKSFSNSYLVDGRGRVLASRQWLGEANGYIALQLLR